MAGAGKGHGRPHLSRGGRGGARGRGDDEADSNRALGFVADAQAPGQAGSDWPPDSGGCTLGVGCRYPLPAPFYHRPPPRPGARLTDRTRSWPGAVPGSVPAPDRARALAGRGRRQRTGTDPVSLDGWHGTELGLAHAHATPPPCCGERGGDDDRDRAPGAAAARGRPRLRPPPLRSRVRDRRLLRRRPQDRPQLDRGGPPPLPPDPGRTPPLPGRGRGRVPDRGGWPIPLSLAALVSVEARREAEAKAKDVAAAEAILAEDAEELTRARTAAGVAIVGDGLGDGVGRGP